MFCHHRSILFAALLVAVAPLSHAKQTAGPSRNAARQPAANSDQPKLAPATTGAKLRDAAWGILKDGAASDKVKNRSDALSAMTIIGGDSASIVILESALTDKEESIRVLAAVSLGRIKNRSAIPSLKAALEDKSPEVSFAAAQALWNMGDRSGRNIFYEVLAGERKTSPGIIKTHVNEAVQEMHDPKALALIGINQVSGAFLGPFSMGVSMAEEYARTTSAPVQALCASLLASDHSRDTMEELKYALADKNWAVRAAAARALASMDRGDLLPRLRDMMLNDKERPARFAAAAAIVRIVNDRPALAAKVIPAQVSAPSAKMKNGVSSKNN